MRLTISHTTRYHYDAPVHYALQQLRLTPKSRAGQTVLRWDTIVEGGRKELEFQDHHNNHVDLVSFEPGRSDITITSSGEVETTDTAGVVEGHGGFTPLWYFLRHTDLTRPGPGVRKLVKALADEDGGDIPRMHALSQLIAQTVRYETGRTHSESTAEDALDAGHGVCQDHAHIFLSAARLMNVPARYVSGYLMMNDRIDQEATHAWVEAHFDNVGWIGFDVSNGISPDERYVRVATGLDYREASPISGMRFGDSGESMIVAVQVQQ